MGILVVLRRIVQVLAGVALVATLLALIPAATLDVGPEGEIRFSFFPLVLASFDPFLRTCLGHSLVIALVVALGSRYLGVPLGRLLFGSRVVGRRIGLLLFVTPLIFPSAFLALGLLGLPELESAIQRGLPYLARLLSRLGFLEWTLADTRGWIGWTCIGLVQGIAVILLVLQDGLGRFDRSWQDSARLAGLSDQMIWRTLIWPSVRPSVARGVRLVFALNLVECGIPLVLGLRRSVGFQIVELAGGPEQFPRLAAASLMTLGCLAVASLLVRLWVGKPRRGDHRTMRSEGALPLWTSPRTWGLELISWVVFAIWATLAWLPIVGLARLAVTRFASSGAGLAGTFRVDLTDPRIHQALLNSLIVGGSAALMLLVVGGFTRRSAAGPRRLGLVPIWGISSVPPLLIGVAALALPRVFDLLARGLRGFGSASPLTDALTRVSAALDPTGEPLRLLVFAVCLEVARRTWSNGDGSLESRDSARDQRDAARVFGVRLPRPIRFPRGMGAILGLARLAFVAVAVGVSVSPAIVLAPTAEGRTLTPEILRLASEGGNSLGRSAGLALIVCFLLLLGWLGVILLGSRIGTEAFAGIRRWCDLDERGSRP